MVISLVLPFATLGSAEAIAERRRSLCERLEAEGYEVLDDGVREPLDGLQELSQVLTAAAQADTVLVADGWKDTSVGRLTRGLLMVFEKEHRYE